MISDALARPFLALPYRLPHTLEEERGAAVGNSADVATSRLEEVVMRRCLSRLSVFAVAVVCPVVASAANEIADPDGLPAVAPESYRLRQHRRAGLAPSPWTDTKGGETTVSEPSNPDR